MADGPQVCWVDGRVEPLDRPLVRADDSAFSEGRGCYSTARVVGGSACFADRHVERLVRGARQLGLGEIDPERLRGGFEALARAAFGSGDGIVRFQASRDGAGALHLVGVPRALGSEPAEWSAIVVKLPHEGAGLAAGLKVSSRLTMALAGDAAREAGVDEALLLDAAGGLVEGSRCNIVVVPASGTPATPPVASGAVAGIARAVVLEAVAGIEERAIFEPEVRGAREIVALNAVRGARPITSLDGAPVGDGRGGPWADRLDEAFRRAQDAS